MDKPSDMRARILSAAEDLLRRHGLAKTNVSDVARVLNMSHANVYRHFDSKASLQDAVAEAWLERVSSPLAAIARTSGPAEQRLKEWVIALARAKHAKVRDDPELFAAYHAIAEGARGVVERHVGSLRDQLAHIIADGLTEGVFRDVEPAAAAKAVLEATLRFHHPHHVREGGPLDEAGLLFVLQLLIIGLKGSF